MNLQQLIKARRQQNEPTDEELIQIHHVLMVTYGWISLEEFRQMPIATMLGLLGEIRKQNEREQNAMKKGRR